MIGIRRASKFGLAIALAATAWACDASTERDESTAISVADIVAEPETYVGRQVTIEADVDDVMGPHAFALDEDAPLAGGVDNDLLVLAREPLPTGAMDDQWVDERVRVTGTVARMDVVEIEREIDWDLNPEIEAEFEDRRAVLIAESVSRVSQ